MYQIDNSSAAAVIPASTAAGTPGFFTDGNPATGVSATIMPAEFMNMVMMEILGVLSAGGVTPSKSNFTQLTAAIRAVNKQATILTDTGTAGAYAAANTPALTVLPATGYVQRVSIANLNPGASTYAPDGLAAKPIYGLGLQPLQGGELPAGIAVLMYLVQAGVNGGNGAWIILESLGGASQVAPATKPLHAMQLGQATGRLLRKSVYINNAGTLQVSVNGAAFVTAASTFTPLALTTAIHAIGQGAGSAGAGSPITTSTQVGCGAGGSAGALCEGFYTSGFSGASIVVGAGGVGVAGAGGGAGGSTALGALFSAPGGPGSPAAAAQVPPTIQGNTLNSGTASGGNIFNGAGQSGEPAVSLNTNAYQSGRGASSAFGAGGRGIGSSYGAGAAGAGYGSGGGGAQAGISSGAGLAGGNGVGGILIIEEFAF
ncbi:hypothetical protein [Pseudomonas sp. OV226]|uniref:hypothetical protein n=1 Tax=Pseudomonas sp. OV226 TaxID=2135588 RepID=UPI000D6B8644|nr:hypothetical protein [Pseudomonas sp. OV226]PWK30846.1 hypothetical protein C7534_1255 [Pseudomonas sp. OV226]